MKKAGFTLAEVLITLGIIGVVAALSAPALVTRTNSAKIGPTLSKTVSTIEVANEQLLNDKDLNSLKSIGQDAGGIYDYVSELVKYLRGAVVETEAFNPALVNYANSAVDVSSYEYGISLSNGTYVMFNENDDATLSGVSSYDAVDSYKGKKAEVIIDVNGAATKPNKLGSDVFVFILDNSGSIIPCGSKQYTVVTNSSDSYWNSATKSNDYACKEGSIGTGIGCAGSVFENNFKVVY